MPDDLTSVEILGMLRLREAEPEGKMREVQTQLRRVKSWLEQIKKTHDSIREKAGTAILTMMVEGDYPEVVLENAARDWLRS